LRYFGFPFWSEPILCLAEARAPRQLQPWPPPHGGSVEGEIPPDDAVGFTTRHGPPGNDGKCLELQINDKAARAFAPATHHRSDRIRQGFFNVPSGGVSANGGLFGFFWTDHCSDGNDLGPLPNAPLVRPTASPKCPESDERNRSGRNVVARSDDDGRTFCNVVQMPAGFVYVVAVHTRLQAVLPEDQHLGICFRIPRYRASAPYLAQVAVQPLTDLDSWSRRSSRAIL